MLSGLSMAGPDKGSIETEGNFFARWAMLGIPTEQRAFGKHIILARYNKQTRSR